MGSIIQKLADEIELHGSFEKYCAWRSAQERETPYFENPEVVNPELEIDCDPDSELVSVSFLMFDVEDLTPIYEVPRNTDCANLDNN